MAYSWGRVPHKPSSKPFFLGIEMIDDTDDDLDESTKVFDSCDETHVFLNRGGAISIMNKGRPDGDAVVVIPLCQVEPLISALRKAKRGVKEGGDEMV